MHCWLPLAVATALLVLSPVAEAAVHPAADFRAGSTFGVGLTGLSYDFGIGGLSMGVGVRGADLFAGRYDMHGMVPGVRTIARFFERDEVSAGVVGGLEMIPGLSGERSFLVWDVGLALAYRFDSPKMALFDSTEPTSAPLALRLNVTLSAAERPGPWGYYRSTDVDAEGASIRPNFFQRLSSGPLTMLGLAYMPNDHLEFTLGGGTLLGMRLKY